jgi:ribosome-associated protein|tara:strand:- start:26 stop:409 length:384 start_codon:yes stop_codon:yes gene_type:complete
LPKKKQIKPNPSGSQLHALRISELMLDKKALDIKIIDVRNITTLTDFFVLCTSESEPQSRAIADHVNVTMKKEGNASWHTEGYQYLDWVLVDFVNIVVHIFSKKAREYYEFERLWADGNITVVQDDK